MKRIIVLILLALVIADCYSQTSVAMQKYLSSEENLNAISNLGPYSTGVLGFDNRYEGIKGTAMLMDTLLPSLLLLNGQSTPISLLADLDVFHNFLIYQHPRTKKMFTVSPDMISEVLISNNGTDMIFRTTDGIRFEKGPSDKRFYQILVGGKYQFIKIPGKLFQEADYKNAYSADRRYDEYIPSSKYYLKGPDSLFHQVQLNRKSVLKVYPSKKSISGKAPSENSFPDKESMITDFIKEF